QDVALRDAEGVVELGDAGVLEAGVVLGRARGVGELVRVDEITEVCPAGMIEVGALGDARLDRPARLPRREGQGAQGEPENASDDGEGCYRPSGPLHADPPSLPWAPAIP